MGPHQVRDPTVHILCIPLGEDMTLVYHRGRSCIQKAFPVTLHLSALKFKKAYRCNIKSNARIIAYASSHAIKCGGRGSVVMKISESGAPSHHIGTTFKPRHGATLT